MEKLIEEIEEVCMSMGYDVVDGPEVEDDKSNFEMLNIPKGCPDFSDCGGTWQFPAAYILHSDTGGQLFLRTVYACTLWGCRLLSAAVRRTTDR